MSYAEKIRALRSIDKYRDYRSNLTEQEFRSSCGAAPIWHSVDLGDVFIEGARKTGEVTYNEMSRAQLPDLTGKSVLDIGAFGGWFSFEAERRGASEVVALDYHAWITDWPKLRQHMAEEKAAGRIGNPYELPKHCMDFDTLPGRGAFDATKRALGSQVDTAVCRFEDYNPGRTFDVVFFLGVLYHCKDPLGALEKVSTLAGDYLVLETLGCHYPGLENRSICDFFGDDRVNNDITNWWAPNDKALTDMLMAVGFKYVEIKSSFDALPEALQKRPAATRTWAHAWR